MNAIKALSLLHNDTKINIIICKWYTDTFFFMTTHCQPLADVEAVSPCFNAVSKGVWSWWIWAAKMWNEIHLSVSHTLCLWIVQFFEWFFMYHVCFMYHQWGADMYSEFSRMIQIFAESFKMFENELKCFKQNYSRIIYNALACLIIF